VFLDGGALVFNRQTRARAIVEAATRFADASPRGGRLTSLATLCPLLD
jgi:hypothetical protein